MFIGVPKEIKADEYSVGLVPATIKELTIRSHQVAVETHAGEGAGIEEPNMLQPAPTSSAIQIRYLRVPN